MANDRQELEDLRRLDELQRKAGGAESTKPAATPDAGTKPHSFLENAAGAVLEPIAAMGSGMIAKPVSDIAGLAATGKEMVSPTPGGGDPAGFAREVQEKLTYQPRTAAGKATTEYNPLALIGKGVGMAGDKAQEIAAPPKTSGPVQSGVGAGIGELIKQLPGLLGAKVGGKVAEGLPAKQAGLDVQKGLNAPLDAIRNQSQAAGLKTPPEGTSWISGIPGLAKTEKWISAENQPQFNKLIAQQFKLPEGTALSKDVLKNVRSEAGKEYEKVVQSGYGDEVTEKQPPKVSTSPIVDERGKPITTETPQPDVKRIPGLPLTNDFKSPLQSSLDSITAQIKESPETFRSLTQSARLLREYIKKDEMNPQAAMEAIKQLRNDAQTGFKSTATNDRQAAFTRMEIADRLEDAFERNLKGEPESLAAFRDARKKIAMSYAVEKVIDKSGNVDAQKLAAIARKRPLTENLKLVADYADAFPKGAKKVTEGKQAISPFDWMFMIGAGPIRGGIELAGRAGLPFLAGKGLLQDRTPQYRTTQTAPNVIRGVGAASDPNQINNPPQ